MMRDAPGELPRDARNSSHRERSFRDHSHLELRVAMPITCGTVLDISEHAVAHPSLLLHRQRVRRGSRRDTRAPGTFQQIVLMPRRFLDDTTSPRVQMRAGSLSLRQSLGLARVSGHVTCPGVCGGTSAGVVGTWLARLDDMGAADERHPELHRLIERIEPDQADQVRAQVLRLVKPEEPVRRLRVLGAFDGPAEDLGAQSEDIIRREAGGL